MAGKWKVTPNRGYYFGSSQNNTWNNELFHRECCKNEDRITAKFHKELLGDNGFSPDDGLPGGAKKAKPGRKREKKRAVRSLSPSRERARLGSTLPSLSKAEQMRLLSNKIVDKDIISTILKRMQPSDAQRALAEYAEAKDVMASVTTALAKPLT